MVDYNIYGNDHMDFPNDPNADPQENDMPMEPGMEGGEDQSFIDGDNPDNPENQRQKHKRRSKNDAQGRDYQCGCGKRYLSYPALYTHIKTKHNGVNPKGTNAPQYQNGRGRGRPRKSNIAISPMPITPLNQNPNLLDKSTPGGGAAAQTAAQKEEELKKQQAEAYNSDEALKRLGATEGDRCEPVIALENLMKQISRAKVNDYIWLQKELKAITDAELDEKQKEDLISVQQKKNCTRILAEYVYDISKKTNEKLFYPILVFVKAFKQCLDEYGWEILRKYKPVTFEERKKEFSTNNDAEHSPELSNDFIRYFLPKEHPKFDKNLGIELTRHLCEWLRKNKYTRSCLALT